MRNKYLLDTNICIELLHGRYHISDKIEEIGIEHCVLSEITIAELYYGAYNANLQKHFREINTLERLFEFQCLMLYHCLVKIRLYYVGKVY